jgi:GT2 family glycosyltransferase
MLTVIYPMIELRGEDVVSPLRSWTREQTFARDRYRVIAAHSEADRAQATAIESLLGPNDELLAVPGRGFAALLNAAIAHARTPWLVLTEGHCIAQAGCLDAVMRWIEANPDGQIGNFELTHLNDNVVTRLVARWYGDMLAQWSTPPNWPHAISGGFAIRASLFEEVGALEPAFSAFSPHVQSARLHSRGAQVTSVPGASVIHLDEASMAEFCNSTSRYARGEFIARSQLDPAFMERYFGNADRWSNQMRLRRDTALAMARAVIAAARTNLGRSAALAGTFVSLLGEAAVGLRPRIAMNRLMLALDAMAIERLPIPEGWRWRRFLRSHQRSVHLAQLEWLRQNPMSSSAALSEGRWTIEQLGSNDIVGVHGLEEFNGHRFRWSEPVAMIRMAPRQTACELRLETGGLRCDPLSSLIAVVIDGRVLPSKYCTSDDKGALTIVLPATFAAAAKGEVILVCAPMSSAQDPRSLGLPIMSIAILPPPSADVGVES